MGAGSASPTPPPGSLASDHLEEWPLGGLLGWTLWEAEGSGSGPGPQPASWNTLSLRAGLCGPQSRGGGTWARSFCGPQRLRSPEASAQGGAGSVSWALTFQLSQSREAHTRDQVLAPLASELKSFFGALKTSNQEGGVQLLEEERPSL